MLSLDLHIHGVLPVNGRRIEDAQKPAANHLIDGPLLRCKAVQGAEAEARGNDSIVIRDQLVIHVSCFRDSLPESLRHRLPGIGCHRLIFLKTADILRDLLGYGGGKDSRIRSRIGDQLLLIKLLGHLQGLVRREAEIL